jgi:hypothetical protein
MKRKRSALIVEMFYSLLKAELSGKLFRCVLFQLCCFYPARLAKSLLPLLTIAPFQNIRGTLASPNEYLNVLILRCTQIIKILF